MPKETTIPKEEMIQSLQKHRNLFYNEETMKIAGPSHSCWQIIAEDLHNQVTSKYLYTIVLLDRFEVRKLLGISGENGSVEGTADGNSTDHERFQLVFQSVEWQTIFQPVSVRYKRKDGHTSSRSYTLF